MAMRRSANGRQSAKVSGGGGERTPSSKSYRHSCDSSSSHTPRQATSFGAALDPGSEHENDCLIDERSHYRTRHTHTHTRRGSTLGREVARSAVDGRVESVVELFLGLLGLLHLQLLEPVGERLLLEQRVHRGADVVLDRLRLVAQLRTRDLERDLQLGSCAANRRVGPMVRTRPLWPSGEPRREYLSRRTASRWRCSWRSWWPALKTPKQEHWSGWCR